MSNHIKYLLGIDGGGTKTEFLLTDSSGNELKRLFLGGTNPVNRGIENTFTVLNEGITKICNDLNFDETSVFAGIAGSKTSDYQKLICDFLADFSFASYNCGSDIDLALEAALNGEDGTAVIMGTGIVAYARSGKKLYRTGGRGYMIDKGGSGFHFGSDALNSAFEYIDGRGGSKTIHSLIEKKLEKKLENSVAEIYNVGASFVASFAPVVFEAYELGEDTAKKIIERNAYEAAKIINAAKKNTDGKTVICGGLCKQKETLYPFLKKYIEGETTLIFLDEPMVSGAVSLAKRMCKNA
ncbi:MAG: hypothetical protein IJB16_04565 [Clostridia bacterium]|nr:hypothetical protein [Clostridia bacterium]